MRSRPRGVVSSGERSRRTTQTSSRRSELRPCSAQEPRPAKSWTSSAAPSRSRNASHRGRPRGGRRLQATRSRVGRRASGPARVASAEEGLLDEAIREKRHENGQRQSQPPAEREVQRPVPEIQAVADFPSPRSHARLISRVNHQLGCSTHASITTAAEMQKSGQQTASHLLVRLSIATARHTGTSSVVGSQRGIRLTSP